jgi:hypothetical protein
MEDSMNLSNRRLVDSAPVTAPRIANKIILILHASLTVEGDRDKERSPAGAAKSQECFNQVRQERPKGLIPVGRCLARHSSLRGG